MEIQGDLPRRSQTEKDKSKDMKGLDHRRKKVANISDHITSSGYWLRSPCTPIFMLRLSVWPSLLVKIVLEMDTVVLKVALLATSYHRPNRL